MFKVSQRTEYALRALMELAGRYGDGLMPAREIAKAQGISYRYIEQQLAVLHKAKIIESHRGPNGGCELARPPKEIRIFDAIEALEGPLAPMHCLEPHDDRCVQSHQCGLQELWSRVEIAVREVFERTTLADLASRHSELQPLLWPTIMTRAPHIT